MNGKQLAILTSFAIGWFLYREKGTVFESMRDLETKAEIMTTGNSCGERNNNPGNIRPGSNWQGMTGTAQCGASGTFVVFSSPVWGIRAIGKDLLTKYSRGLNTIRKIITVYAPPSENNTNAYIDAVAREVGVSADTLLNMRDVRTITGFVYAIIKHENGRVIYTPAQVAEGVSLALNG